MGAFKYLTKRLVKNIGFTKTQLREEKLLLKAIRDSKKDVSRLKGKIKEAKGAKRKLLADTAGKKASFDKSKSQVDSLSNVSKQIKERMAKIGAPPWPPGTVERVKKYTKMQKDITKKMKDIRKKL